MTVRFAITNGALWRGASCRAGSCAATTSGKSSRMGAKRPRLMESTIVEAPPGPILDVGPMRGPPLSAMGERSGDVGRAHRAVVAEGHLDEKRFLQVPAVAHAELDDRRRLEIEHHQVGFH